MRLIHHFDTIEQYEENRTMEYTEPWLSLTEENWGIHYNMDEEEAERRKEEKKERMKEVPLTFEILSDGYINWKSYQRSSSYFKTIEYSKNDGEWTTFTSSSGGTKLNVTAGDKVKFRGDNVAGLANNGQYYVNTFTGTTCQFKISGNIMSLLYKDTFSNETTISGAYSFCQLFAGCSGLIDASNLVLPATTLAYGCYYSMFNGCTGLTQAPSSIGTSATTMAASACTFIFRNCTSLTTAPELPATNLSGAPYCYYYMFYNCTSLVQAPALPATTLASECYYYMFYGCTNLTQAPELPATTLAQYCYREMFWNCTSLTTAPELPATTLVYGCYNNMFRDCSNLNYIKCLATDISAAQCTSNWVQYVQTTSGTFVKAPSMTGWSTGTSGIPDNWTVQDAT